MSEESSVRLRIAEIEGQIKALQAELRSLNNIIRHHSARERLNEVTNRRSYERIYNEENIKSIIHRNGGSSTSRQIFYKLIEEGLFIKESTLRSYLTRMAYSGEIKYDQLRKKWMYSKDRK